MLDDQTDSTGGSGQGGSQDSGRQENQGSRQGQEPGTGFQFVGQFDPDRAARLIENLQGDKEQLRQQVQGLQGQVQEFQNANATELQQRDNKITEQQAEVARLEQLVRYYRTRVLAADVGIGDTEAATALLKWDELGEAPEDEKVSAALNQLLKDRPYLATDVVKQQARGVQAPDVSATNGGRSQNREQPAINPGIDRVLAAYNSRE